MEKIVSIVRGDDRDEQWCSRLRGPVAEELLDLGVAGLTVNVRDDTVRHSLMTLTTLDPPVAAVVSIWMQQSYGEQLAHAVTLLQKECESPEHVAAYLVTESVPLPPPAVEFGSRTPGLANVALLRRPETLDAGNWRERWQLDHTPVAIATQATFGYTQNAVVRPVTPAAPDIAAIVEELFPIAALTDLMAFFGAADDADLHDRITQMVASTSAFGANDNIDTVPTSRYVLRSPFVAS